MIGGMCTTVPINTGTYREDAIQALHDAGDLLARSGWCQRKGWDMETGGRCATSALFSAAGHANPLGWVFSPITRPRSDTVALLAIRAVAHVTGSERPEDDHNVILVQSWNDWPGRTVEDVQMAYKQAIEYLESMNT